MRSTAEIVIFQLGGIVLSFLPREMLTQFLDYPVSYESGRFSGQV